MERLKLPVPDSEGLKPFETCMTYRRSVRKYDTKPLTLVQIGQLCFSAQGITDDRGMRASPSAGATFPAEIYLVAGNGWFHYLPVDHELERISDADLRPGLCKACYGQGFVKEAWLSVLIGMVGSRTTGRYGGRAERYIALEAGHIAQNLHLQAISLGLESVAVGAYDDDEVSRVLDLPDIVEPTYIVTIGYGR